MIFADDLQVDALESRILDRHAEQRVFVIVVASRKGILMQDQDVPISIFVGPYLLDRFDCYQEA